MKIDPDAYYVAKINYTSKYGRTNSIWTLPMRGNYGNKYEKRTTVEEMGNFLASVYLNVPYDSVEVYVLPTAPVVTVNSE